MQKVQKIFEIGYLLISVFLFINAITTFTSDKKMSGMYLLFAIMAVFMFFFKRNFRKKSINRKDSNQK